VAECLQEERSRLLPLPTALPSEDQVIAVTADHTATVRFDGNAYSVPPEQAGRTCTLAIDQHTLRVLEGTRVIATHARCWGRGQRIEDPKHRAAILASKPGTNDLKGRDRLRREVPSIDSLFQAWLRDGHAIGGLVRRATRLLDTYGASVVCDAVTTMLDRGTYDPGALEPLCEQSRRTRQRPVLAPMQLSPHVPERDVIPHALEGYDREC
jgi:hypothetical protein